MPRTFGHQTSADSDYEGAIRSPESLEPSSRNLNETVQIRLINARATVVADVRNGDLHVSNVRGFLGQAVRGFSRS